MKQATRTIHNQIGDTIVEVLIAMAIVSTVIVGAFIVTQKSVTAVRGGQEHAEALQQLQGQVELVRSLALTQSTDSGGVFSHNFCIDQTDAATLSPVPDSSAACKLNQLYNVTASYVTNGSDKHFVFITTWPALGGGTNKEQLVYRIYPGIQNIAAASVTPNPAPTTVPSLPAVPAPDPYNPLNASVGGIVGGTCWTSPLKNGWSDPGCWHVTIRNLSENPNGILVTCSINWGDGKIETYPAADVNCQKGTVMGHYYTPQPQPADSHQYKYYVTITNTASNGLSKTSAPQTEAVPY